MRGPSSRGQSRVASKTVVRHSVSSTRSSITKKAPKVTSIKKVTRPAISGSKLAAKRTPTVSKVEVTRKPAKKTTARVAPKKKPAKKPATKIIAKPKATRTTSKKVVKARAPVASRNQKPGKITRRIVPPVAIKVSKRIPPPPPPEPLRRQPSTGVLKSFEQAVKVFNRRQFTEARGLFEALQSRYPQEVEINARAQTYIQVCNQKMARPVSSPRSADEFYDRGVVALNIGDFTQARTFFEKALRLRPDEPHLLYSLAATYAQTGSHDQALDYLHRSIQMQPRYRSQVINDSDFTQLHNDKRFLEILGVSSPLDLFDSVH